MANDFYDPTFDFEPFNRVTSSQVDAELAGVAAGFAKLPSKARLDSGNTNYVAAAGTADALTLTMPTTWTSYTGKGGSRISVKIASTNTGAVTANVDGLGTKAVLRNNGDALVAGDLQAGGFYDLVYNESAGNFRVNANQGIVTDASAQASAASASASAAATSATNAATSASAASTSASNASTSATNAATSASEAAASAASVSFQTKDTVAAMVADTALSAGQVVDTAGKDAVGDGGQERYLLVAGDSSNGLDRILLDAGVTAVKQERTVPALQRQSRDVTISRDFSSDTFTMFDGVATTEHYHEPKMCEGYGGRIHMSFRNGTEHGVDGQWDMVYVYSDDGGRTWSAKQVLGVGSATTIYGPTSCLQTPSGKLIIAYNELTISGSSVQAPVIYKTKVSVDNGATWSDGPQIDSINFSFARLFGRMKVIPAHGTEAGYRLGVTAYHQSGTGPSTFRSTIYYSDDDGLTWAEGTPIVDDTNGDNETEFVFVTDSVGFAVTRATVARLFKTQDAGATWDLVGEISNYSNAFDPVAPTLDKFEYEGIWYVLLGMFMRSDDEMAWSVAAAEDIVSDSNAWSGKIDSNLGYGNASGYQCPAVGVDGNLDVKGGIGYAIVEEFVGSDDSKLNISYLDVIKQVELHPREYTVSSGAISLGNSRLEPSILLDTEGNAATDDLDTVNGGHRGQIITITNVQATSARDVTLKSNTGNLYLNGDYTLLDLNSFIVLQKASATKWVELARAQDQVSSTVYDIATGVVTLPDNPLPAVYLIGTEASAATDDLDTISGGVGGQIVILQTPGSSRDVTYKDDTGNLKLAGDFTATRPDDTIALVKRGTNWYEISRSDNLA